MATVNWCYTIKPPRTNLQDVEEQMYAAHKFRNKLCELEIARREEVEQTLRNLAPDYLTAQTAYALAEDAVNNIFNTIKAERAKARGRISLDSATKDQVKTAKENRKVAYASLKAIKAHVFDRVDIISKLAELELQHKTRIKAAYALAGCHWGTRLEVMRSCESFRKGAPPKFARYNANKYLSVQCQGGLLATDLLNCSDTRLRLALTDQGNAKQRHAKALLSFRIGSDGKTPIWSECEVHYHRPLPLGSVIKWAHLQRTRIGTKTHWSLRLTIDIDRVSEPQGKPAVAVHPGWRKLSDGSLRVACWAGADGKSGELVLPKKQIDAFDIPDQLRSVRDAQFNTIRLRFKEWLDSHQSILPTSYKPNINCHYCDGTGVKDEKPCHCVAGLADRVSSLMQWRDIARLASLVIFMREHRFAGDEELFPVPPSDIGGKALHDWHKMMGGVSLESWRKQDKHLLEWEANQRHKSITNRNQCYRVFVSELLKNYSTVVVPNTRWSDLLKRDDVDQTDIICNTVRRYGHISSPATLIGYLTERFGTNLLKVVSANLTAEHFKCGIITNGDGLSILRECECGSTYDIDHNAALNQLARAEAAKLEAANCSSDSGDVKTIARKSRWKNRKGAGVE